MPIGLAFARWTTAAARRRQIVCGAKNYKVGDKVPLALPGAVLPNEFKIKASKLRGVESQGMLCSAKELGIAEDAAGLLILSPEAKIGAPIGELFPDDTILDVEITPNRADLLSHYGLAREIAALTQGKRSACRSGSDPVEASSAADGAPAVQISPCASVPFIPRAGSKTSPSAPSPDWLRARLEAVGLRAINNIVDITNFVMLEIGQPLHAFDADKLEGGINVRLAQPNEKFLALDGRTYHLARQNMLIADAERGVAIGGVMGGEETGVTRRRAMSCSKARIFCPPAFAARRAN